MKKGLTELVFILDKSGSMAGLETDTIGGFNAMLEKQKVVEGECLITTVLFALWHFGYVDSLAARIGFDGLGYVMLMKASVGLVYGVIVGFVRYKTKNAYASILLHGVMNVFGR